MGATYWLRYKQGERPVIRAQNQALERHIRRIAGRYLLQISMVFVAYVIAGKLGQATTNIRSSNLGPVWPAYGIALAAILVCGYRVWPGVAAGAFLVAFFSSVSHLAAFGQATGATVAAMTGAFLLHRIADFNSSLSRLSDALSLITIGGFGSALVSSSIGVAVLYATHVHAYSGLGAAWVIYWLGDATGVLLVTPLALRFTDFLKLDYRNRVSELAILLVLLAATCFVIFGDLPSIPIKLHVMAFAVLPFIIWAAIRFGVGITALSILIVAAIATIETALGSGPFTSNTKFLNAVLLDVFFGVLSISGLSLAAVIVEREHAEGERERVVSERAAMEARLQAAHVLRLSEERWRFAAQAGKMYAYDWDVETDAVVRSEESTNILGSTGERFLTRQQLLAKIHPDDRAKFVAAVDDLTPENTITHITYRVFRDDGTVIWLETHGRAFFNPKGKMLRIVGMVADITESRRVEERLREYEKAVEGAEEMIAVVDREYRYLIANRQFLKMCNVTSEQVVGHFAHEILNKGVFEAVVKEKLDECFEGKVVRYEMKYTYPVVGERDLLASYFPIESASGIDRVACILQDITERKRAEEALRESEEKFRNVFRDAGVGMVLVSPEGRFLAANKTFCDCIGYTEEELLQKTVESITFPEDWPAFSEKLGETLTDGHGFQWFEKRCLHKSGRIVYTENSASVIRSREGVPQYLVGQVLDITERKAAEKAISGMARKLVETQEQERARIARELHDDINQRLAMLAVELEQLQDDPSEVRSRLQELRTRTIEISNGVQALSHDLHSSQLEYLGAVAGIKSWCEEFSHRQGIQVDFRQDVRSTLPEEIGLCLFRVLQEALHNAVKHSGMKRIEVQLQEEPGEIHLIIKDLGKGFAIETARHGRGLGLTSMQERVRLVNGMIDIQSKPMGGTTIHLRVPLDSGHGARPAAG